MAQKVVLINLSQCLVGAFRYDVHRPNRNCVFLGLTMQSGALSTVCYFVGLVFHLAATKMDDQISLSTKQNDIWPDIDVCITLVVAY